MRGGQVAVFMLLGAIFWWLVIEFTDLVWGDLLWVIPGMLVVFIVIAAVVGPRIEAAEFRRKLDEDQRLLDLENARLDERFKREDAEAELAEARERAATVALVHATAEADAHINRIDEQLRSQGLTAAQIALKRSDLFIEALKRHRRALGLKPDLPPSWGS